MEAGCRLGSLGAFGERWWGLLRVLLPLISICPAHGAVASEAPHVTHGPLCPLFPHRKTSGCHGSSTSLWSSWYDSLCIALSTQRYIRLKPQEKYNRRVTKTDWKAAFSHKASRGLFLRAPTSSSLISTLLSADTPPLSASVWFPSCCNNLFMVNLDLQLLACEAFAFSSDFF